MGISLVGCSQNSSSKGKYSNEKIAYVPGFGAVEDDTFNETIWKSIQDYAGSNSIEYTVYQPETDTDSAREDAVKEAVEKGATIIILSGNTYATCLEEIQNTYSSVHFAVIDVAAEDMEEKAAENVYTCSFAEEQAGYLAGYGAVMEGYTQLGFLGGTEIKPVKRYGYGYIQGADAAAASLRTHIEIKYAYSGQFYGDSVIDEQMNTWYKDGTQVVFSCGGEIYNSVLKAAISEGGMLIGVDADQNSIGDKYSYNPFLTSATKGIGKRTSEILETYFEGNWEQLGGHMDILGLKDGDYVGLPVSNKSWRFSTYTLEQYNELVGKITSGDIVVSSDVTKMPQVSEYTSIIND